MKFGLTSTWYFLSGLYVGLDVAIMGQETFMGTWIWSPANAGIGPECGPGGCHWRDLQHLACRPR